MLGNPGGTGGHGPEVAGELVLVSAGNRRVAVSSEELVEVAVDPHISHLLVALLEDQPREPAAQCSGDIVPQVWTRGLWSEPIRIAGFEPFEHRSAVGPEAQVLALGQAEHVGADQPPRPRPHALFKVGSDAAGQNEAARPWVVVDSPLDRAEHAGDFLPLIEKHRFRPTA